MNAPMSWKPRAALFSCWIALMFLAASPLKAGVGGEVVLPDSVRGVEEAAGGAINPHKALVTRRSLKAEEAAAPLVFEVALRMRNFGELSDRIAAGERVSPQEMAARYEPSAADYDAVAEWLTGQGLAITRRDPHHMAIFARGKISDIQRGLGVTFARVALAGQEYTSAITEPSVPAGLAPRLLGINGLQPHIRAHKHLIRPQGKNGGASYFPKQIEAAYQATSLYNANVTGAGESIAIVIDTFPAASDLKAFWKAAGIDQSITNIQFIQAVEGTLPAPSGEETLVTEWSSSIAPRAQVRVYAATDLASADVDQAYEQVYEDVLAQPELGIRQMSMSYGEGETYTTNAQVKTDDQYFAELAAAGVSVFASSGDAGSTPGPLGPGDESGSLQVESPASDPNVTGVGGTTLILDSTNGVTSETVWNAGGGASGGGLSEYFTRPKWQTGTGVRSANQRQVPDVAGSADPAYGAEYYFEGSLQDIGGTSWSSPTWAGFCALMNEARTSAGQASIGLLGRSIYPLLSAPNYPVTYNANFRDITAGNNTTPQSGADYYAATGYDLCSGLGTPLMGPLVKLLAATSALVGVETSPAVDSVTPGKNAAFTVTVTGTASAYEWQRMPIGRLTWTTLSNAGAYSGVSGTTLTITDATPAMSGDQFQCVLTIESKKVTTVPPSVLVVSAPLSVSTLAGEVETGGFENGQGAGALFNYPSGVAVDGSGNVYVADYGNNAIREIAPNGTVTTPYGSTLGYSGFTNGAGNNALFNEPNDVATDGSNNLYVADTGNNLIRKIRGGTVSTMAGTNGEFDVPDGVTVDGSGNVYVADMDNDTIDKITPQGTVSVLAGKKKVSGFTDGAATTVARFDAPSGVAVDGSGNVYVADSGNCTVRKIAAGEVTTVAGQAGDPGYLDGLSGKSLFNSPIDLAVDGDGNVYIADALVPPIGSTAAGNNVLRELTPAGVVSTIAGQVGQTGADNGTGSTAQFYSLQAVAVGSQGLMYLADTYNQTIRVGISTVLPEPVIGANPAVYLGVTDVQAVESVNPHGLSTVVYFEYGTSTSYGSRTASQDTGSGDAAVNVSALFSALTPGALYHFRIVATSAAGTYYGPDDTFTTMGFVTDVVAMAGDAAAGVAKAEFSTFDNPAINELDRVAFGATLETGLGGVTAANSTGIWAENSAGTRKLAARAGGIAPSTNGAVFASFSNPVYNKSEEVAFVGTLKLVSGKAAAANDMGVWSGGSGSLELVARKGRQAPGCKTGATFGTFDALSLPDEGGVILLSTLNKDAAAGVTAANDKGIWAGSTAAKLQLVMREGDTYNGKTITSIAFLPALSYVNGQTRSFAQGTGDFVYWAEFSDNSTGIFEVSGANLRALALSGDSTPGVAGGVFSGFGNPAVNAHNYVAYTGTLETIHGGVTAADEAGIWADDSAGTLELIAREGSAAPGTTGTFATLSDPVYNDNEAAAFRGTLAAGEGGVTSTSAVGVWSNWSGAMILVTRQGSQAPGCPTGVTFAGFTSLALPNEGGVIMLATLNANAAAGITSANNRGIWAEDAGGKLQLIVKEGDILGGKTITGLSFLPAISYTGGQTRSFAQSTGDLVYGAAFSDSSSGIFEVVFP